MTDLLPISLADQIASVRREIGMRKGVYPRWVASGKIKQDAADREIERMEAVLKTLMDLQAKGGDDDTV